ncbi:acetyl-CoA hydrolase/transferase family protein [Pelistega europaea]|uniref:Acetyl-CoA hydrolase/transferase family protein n=1 Tax=Pelistega europaea TaxID=106147 RepID=A0A7Y4P5H3_9BURK|nr:acetyl-CoA hydrolase/transferase family protein [Pelistega europaea]NOL48735.1 acetyl-CoA hydrolase/transferase family protein [Pelistega europaea]
MADNFESLSRIKCKALLDKVMSPEEAAALIPSGVTVGMSGFTGSGYPKRVPAALAKRILEEHAKGKPFKINVWTGASTAPELDGVLAEADGINMRLPYQSDPTCRQKINSGQMHYMDIHLSHVAQYAWFGFLGKLNIAVIEVVGIREDGTLIPAASVGNNKTWIDQADQVIIEVNYALSEKLEGMHDIYYGTALPPHRKPVLINEPDDRIGTPYYHCPPEKIIAVVETYDKDRVNRFSEPDEVSKKIATHILNFLKEEVRKGVLPPNLLPLQSGVGDVSNAVISGLEHGDFDNLTAYTEVIQDGMLGLIKSGKLKMVSATSLSLSPEGVEELNANIDFYRERIILRTQEISNHPEVIRRLGTIAINGMIEADIYGNVNSTHIMGSAIMNGIGGSGDFARNSFLSFFVRPSIAKDGDVSAIVPMVSHVDHTEHDVQIIVTEQGLADLRGLSPRQRAEKIIENCAHPDYKEKLRDYFTRAQQHGAQHTPHILSEALSWHDKYLKTGSMK